MGWKPRNVAAYAGVVAMGAVLCAFPVYKYGTDITNARRAYVERRTQESDRIAARVEASFRAFYQGLRTMAALPGVRAIDRYGENFHPDSRASMQQIYNNTYLNVTLSEVYLLPATLDPDRIDPHTGQPEAPILTFDEFITGGAEGGEGGDEEEEELEEVEIFEYRLMREQLRTLAVRYPTRQSFKVMDVPGLMGAPVVTCDNSEFHRQDLVAGNDGPRLGFVYTLPVYGEDGRFRGAVSGVVRVNVIERLLPPGDYALSNHSYGYLGMTAPTEALQGSLEALGSGRADPQRIYSERRSLEIVDGSPWELWVSAPDETFWAEPTVQQAQLLCRAGLAGALGLTCLFLIGLTFLLKNEQILARRVEDATQALAGRNLAMRRILDHAAEGFCTVGLDGKLFGEHSAAIERWFGAPGGQTLATLLFGPEQQREREMMELGWEQVAEDLMPLDVTQSQLPKNLQRDGRFFSLSLTAIRDERGQLQALLAVITDVTAQRRVAEQELAQRELVAVVEGVVRDAQGFLEFIEDASGIVERLQHPQPGTSAEREFQAVHTLKGNCAQMGVASLGHLLHDLESELVESKRTLSEEERAGLAAAWAGFRGRIGHVVGRGQSSKVEVDHLELFDAIKRVSAGAPPEEVAALLRSWQMIPVRRRIERLAQWTEALARRLGVESLELDVSVDNTRLPPEAFAAVWPTLTHLIRNAVDHGVKGAQRAGDRKPRILLGARTTEEMLEISVSDNGQGVDWEAVRAKALGLGLASETTRDLVDALFADGLSTRQEASEVSGRGVGMSAVEQAARGLGGEVKVASAPGQGTMVIVQLPLDHPSLRPEV